MSEAAAQPYTRLFGAAIAGSRTEPLPADLREKFKLLVLDTIGCGLLGAGMPWIQRLLDTFGATEQPGPALVWGTAARFSPAIAALVNGTSVHGFETDDVGAGGHNGSVTLTAALALAEGGAPLSGAELLRALVTGAEVAARVQAMLGGTAQAINGFHGPGLVGTFGAMATAATVLRLDAEQTVNAIGNAAQQAGGLMGTHHGGMGKRLLAGKAAHSGVLGAQLAAHGFTNVDNILDGGYGSFPAAFSGARDVFDLSKLLDGWGDKFLSYGVNFKLWSCRVPIHPVLEAIKTLRREDPLDPDTIEAVEVKLALASFRAVGFPYQPTTITSAQLNLQYCLAIMLLENDVSVGQFTEEKIASPRVLDVIRRLHITHDPDLDAGSGLVVSRQNAVTVRLRDGRTLSATGVTRGTAGAAPISRDEVVAKFRKLTTDILAPATQDWLIDACDRLEELPDARALTQALVAPARQAVG